ncbi:hypothetical protein Sru01_49650 [Sphaerisporangium rufum]|uniref:Uncharacterized protein n=1 Tax=Sphaerisporangium rufum TaxID=1381558 RepID=A0A919R661_9ACTN|nr:hypothetical protein Sru01_49650 [Sphaerisporangium rufum]
MTSAISTVAPAAAGTARAAAAKILAPGSLMNTPTSSAGEVPACLVLRWDDPAGPGPPSKAGGMFRTYPEMLPETFKYPAAVSYRPAARRAGRNRPRARAAARSRTPDARSRRVTGPGVR